ncbi:MAG: hypothetical protein K0S04_3104 [Herbinix sp.]|jgi:hypothetical protein|nr:hypothetical protein [Herbinix sp.]
MEYNSIRPGQVWLDTEGKRIADQWLRKVLW